MKITICVEFVNVLVSLAFVPDFQLNFIFFAIWVVPLSGLCKPIEHLRASRAFMYNPFLVYCHELAPGTVSLTGDRAQGDDSKHDSHYTFEMSKSAFAKTASIVLFT